MKPMYYKDDDGTKYKISFSEELQMKNLNAAKENTTWLRRNFYAKIALVVIMLIMVVTFLFLLYRLDQVNFFTILMTR